MKQTRPAYYDQFRCIAGACPDSCCQEWDVQVDEGSARRYLALSGPLGDRLRQKLLKDEDGDWTLQITDRRCPMWRQDGLCQIQYELGEEALCQVCRQFPRLRHDYGDFLELGLELSCPEAARIILSAPSAAPLVTQIPGGEPPGYDREAMEVLLRTREEALRLLDSHPLPQAAALLLLYAYHAQDQLDGAPPEPFHPGAELSFAHEIAQPYSREALCRFYGTLEILTPRWRDLLDRPGAAAPWQEAHRAFLRYGIQRYWLQAVSDYDLTCRVKLLISGCVLIKSLGTDTLGLAQLWSKEIENSAENVEALLDAAYTAPALTDAQLLGALLEA